MLLALLLTPPASAYNLLGWAWPPEAQPVEIHWTGEQPGLTHDELAEAIDGAAAAWTAASPGAFAYEVVEDAAAASDTEHIVLLFGDPEGTLGDTVLGEATGPVAGKETVESNGNLYQVPTSGVFTLNDIGGIFATDADIAAGDCDNQISLQGLLTQYLGFVAGLAESCAEGEPCDDPDAVDATMYWAFELCDARKSTLGADDIAGIVHVYGGPGSEPVDDGGGDTGVPDTGVPDTGVPDTDTADSGGDDSGADDSSAPADDTGGTSGDDTAGTAGDDTGASDKSGCGCATGGLGSSGLLVGLAVGAAGLLRRRGMVTG